MNSNHSIQIFYEEQELEIKPSRTYRDPVSKFRVSNPQSIIDTDFEYGLQPTKWETLKIINNVPTSYASQSSDEAIVITSIKVNGDIVTVDTETNHELTAGSVVEIVGLSDPKYEGVFVVKSIQDANTFSYKIPFVSEFKDLYTIYSLTYPGSFYTGSSIKILDAKTDGLDPASSINISTNYTHGLNNKTKLYLKKSRAIKRFTFNHPNNVVGAATTILGSTVNGNGVQNISTIPYYHQKILAQDYTGYFELYVDTNQINISNGDITYNLTQQIGESKTTPLKNGDVITFHTPVGNLAPSRSGTSSSFVPFKVFDVRRSGDQITFKISTSHNPSFANAHIFTSPGTTTFGKHRIIKGTKVTQITADDTITTDIAHGIPVETAPVGRVIIATTLSTTTDLRNLRVSKNNGEATPNYVAYRYSSVTARTLKLGSGVISVLGGTTVTDPNNGTNTLTFPTTKAIVAVFRIQWTTLQNTIYLPPASGYSSSSFENGQLVRYSISGTNAVAIGGLTNNTNYLLRRVTGNWYRVYPVTNNTLTNYINLSVTQATAERLYVNTTHRFESTINRKDSHTIQIVSPRRGGLSNNESVRYSAESGVSVIGGLSGDVDYRIKSEDSLIPDDKFRLATTTTTRKIFSASYAVNATTARINIQVSSTTTSLADIGITQIGQIIQVTGVSSPVLTTNNFFNGLHRVTFIGTRTRFGTTNFYFIPVNVEVDTTKNRAVGLSIPNTETATLTNTKVCGITSFTNLNSTNDGSHFIFQNNIGSVDDIYVINGAEEESFNFTVQNNIPSISFNFLPSAVSIASSHIRIPNHYFADGTTVRYSTTGTPIGGLSNAQNYYIRVLDSNYISLTNTPDGAVDREQPIISLSSIGTGNHNFTTTSISGWIPGSGTVAISTESNTITGTTATKFLSDFSNGDIFRVYTTGASAPGNYFESKIISINDNRRLKLQDIPEFASSTANYFIPTSLYAISNGKIVHRPFDGGVNMSTGLSPNSQVIRQTRKYFRYQSGKGIQASMAINFNPTFDINDITPSLFGYARVSCRDPHQLSINSINSDQKIKFSGVNSSDNQIIDESQSFNIVSISSDFDFEVDISNSDVGITTVSNLNWTFEGTQLVGSGGGPYGDPGTGELGGFVTDDGSDLLLMGSYTDTIVNNRYATTTINASNATKLTFRVIAGNDRNGGEVPNLLGAAGPDLFKVLIGSSEREVQLITVVNSTTTRWHNVEVSLNPDERINNLQIKLYSTKTGAVNEINQNSFINGVSVGIPPSEIAAQYANANDVYALNWIKVYNDSVLDSLDLISGFPQYNVVNWGDCSIKAGMFDDQNGFYFEYDGNILYACRRSSTQQISGLSIVRRGTNKINGENTRFDSQLNPGDRIVVRGQTYKVTKVYDNNIIDIQPSYRGADANNVVISKVIDTKVPQSEWNLDRMDGTGESGYNLNINKIQMIYMDYSWYGAGTIRFGFKDTIGEVRYCHEFYHNNIFTESYMRSGNIPARYEVETFDAPLFSPSLFHWGASVIMDGRFDDDKAYLFTAESKSLPFTNGGATANFTGTGTAGQTIIRGISFAEFNTGITVGETIIQTNGLSNIIQPGTLVQSIEVDPNSRFGNNPSYLLNISKPLLINLTGTTTLNCTSGTANDLKTFTPLVTIRLAPSVDNATGANLGFRDIINRMQLTLKSAGVLVTHDCEVRLILNARLSNDEYQSIGSPSLSQIYKHNVGDTFTDGTTVLAFRAQGGSILDAGTGRRGFNVTDTSLDEIALLGNSILGGDSIYPDGPDILTVAVKPVDTSQIRGSSPFIVTGRITWAESQA